MTKRRTTKPSAPAMPSVFAAYDAMSAAGVLDCRETSALKPQAESYAEKYPNDRWDLFEALPKFRAWVCDPFVYTNGSRYRFAVVDRAPYSGLGWVCLVYTVPLRGDLPKVTDESGGAFYDGADDHPEGAIEWAKKSALAVKVRAYDSTDWDERMARVYDLKKRAALPVGDPGMLDAPWKDVLISLGYTPEDAHALALRPTPKPLSPELPGKLVGGAKASEALPGMVVPWYCQAAVDHGHPAAELPKEAPAADEATEARGTAGDAPAGQEGETVAHLQLEERAAADATAEDMEPVAPILIVWTAATAERGDAVHVVVGTRVEIGRWAREPGQALCKPRGMRLKAATGAPSCKGCLGEAEKRNITL